MHEKAAAVPADEVVFDLEDAVAPGAKHRAREAIAATLARPEWRQRVVAVRVNPVGSPELAADLELVGSLAQDESADGRGSQGRGAGCAGGDRGAAWRSDRVCRR